MSFAAELLKLITQPLMEVNMLGDVSFTSFSLNAHPSC